MSYLDYNSCLKWNTKFDIETLDEHQAFRDTNDSGIKENLIGLSTILEETLQQIEVAIRPNCPIIKGFAVPFGYGNLRFDSILVRLRSIFFSILQRDTNWPAERSYLREP